MVDFCFVSGRFLVVLVVVDLLFGEFLFWLLKISYGDRFLFW